MVGLFEHAMMVFLKIYLEFSSSVSHYEGILQLSIYRATGSSENGVSAIHSLLRCTNYVSWTLYRSLFFIAVSKEVPC